MTIIQGEKWSLDIDLLGLRLSSAGFEISVFTVYFKEEYRSLFSIGIWFKELWILDILFYKFKD